jgi:hypothetical protein
MLETLPPTSDQIAKLIAAARNHPLGTNFLLEGDLCAVAVIFGAHVFTIECVREHWEEIKHLNPEEGAVYGV